MTSETIIKWESVFSDQDYAKKLLNMSREGALEDLQSRGYDFTVDDMDEMFAEIQRIAKQIGDDGELSKELLEEISGGGHIGSFVGGVATVAGAAVVGFAGGCVLGLACW